jgi:hypothetical protein
MPTLEVPMFLLALLGCQPDPKTDPPAEACDPVAAQADAPAIVPGAPMAGAAESFLSLPIGTPLSGYTSRCDCFGGDGDADRRDSAYTYSFAASAGVQTPIPVKAFWIANGDQDLAIIKVDLIYSFDGLVEEMERRLSAATGKDMDGKVVVATSHSHSSHGDFSDQIMFYLGSDRFNYEVFTRMAETAEATAMEAYDGLQPAKIGVGYAKDWDPTDAVYHDRRDDNNDLQFFPDIPAGSYKDPNLTLIRLDTLDDQPIGVLFDFGMHGTILDADSPMISVDAPGHVEEVFQERFDTPVVVAMLQGGAGDSSPSGSDDGYARLETIGEAAADALEALWTATPTSAEPMRLETTSRSVVEAHDDFHITRHGTVDLHYKPYVDDDDFVPDDVVYEADGTTLVQEIDEFNVPYGAAFCGENPAYLPGYAPATAFPYVDCVEASKLVGVIKGFFDLNDQEAALPIPESTRAAFTATRFGPVAIHDADGTDTTDDVFMGFFPGEPTSMFTEQFRRRAAAELGYHHSVAVGYSQDHEGYLLLPEDWLQGGYEADINVWGPLQAEYIMEQLLNASAEVLSTDVVEHPDPCDEYQPVDYEVDGAWTLPENPPEASPEAGTLLATSPDYLWSPLYTEDDRRAGTMPDLTVPATVARVQGLVQMAWIGGDPGVDYPTVTLEHQTEGGSWETVLTGSGRPVSNGPDILLAHTPDPLLTFDQQQTHYWYAAWQAVGHVADRAGLPVGTYRLHVAGHSYVGDSLTYPWDTDDYTVDSSPFELTPATITLARSGSDLSASLVGPERGYRLVGMDGAYRGNNPLPEDWASVHVVYGDGTSEDLTQTGTRGGGVTTFAGVIPDGAVEVDVEDVYGNRGTLPL